MPDAGQACICSPFAITHQASTECGVANQHGTCIGERVCAAEGLSACDAASAQTETCNGLDDDCDGETDKGYTAVLPDGTEVTGVGVACGIGVCEGGVTTCNAQGDGIVCTSAAKATTELCDGLDNDCNGVADDGLTLTQPDGSVVAGLGQPCGLGECAAGTTVCDASTGSLACSAASQAGDEFCDGQDNDCDGVTDGDDPGLLAPLCETQQGVCAGLPKAVTLCAGGTWSPCGTAEYQAHSAAYAGDTELVCDGVDDDCDGTADEDFALTLPDGTVVAGPSNPCGSGACLGGSTACNGAKNGILCSTTAGASSEFCDGIDNDCDGFLDAADADLAVVPCDKLDGVCAGAEHTLEQCQGEAGWLACTDEQYTAWNAAYETTESECDELDTDCDGLTDAADPDLAAVVVLCEHQEGVCGGATKPPTLCGGGQWLNCWAPVYLGHHGGFQAEVETSCDGLDNDCDGTADEDFALTLPDGTVVAGPSNPCGSGACLGGSTACNGAKNGILCSTTAGASSEVCDGIDNDCDGFLDAADADLAVIPCDKLSGVCAGTKRTLDQCQGQAGWLACTDDQYTAWNSAYETTESECDKLDTDCDGLTDAADPDLASVAVLCEDQDGICEGATKPPSLCGGGQWSSCSAPVYLGHHGGFQVEVETGCDGLDNDCDGSTDEDFTLTLADGSQVAGTGQSCGVGACAGGTTACTTLQNGLRCSSDGLGSTEVCDGQDNDCDGKTDAADPTLSLGACDNQTGVCSGATHPASQCVNGQWQACTAAEYGAFAPTYGSEACDNLDNDCNGSKDPEGASGCTHLYKDGDTDTYGDPDEAACVCGGFKSGYVGNQLDCYDGDGLAKPQAPDFHLTQHGGGDFDWDCDGTEEKKLAMLAGVCELNVNATNLCQPTGNDEGWSGAAPACGMNGTWLAFDGCHFDGCPCNDYFFGICTCFPDAGCYWTGTTTKTQECR
jgi:hypothetical protein